MRNLFSERETISTIFARGIGIAALGVGSAAASLSAGAAPAYRAIPLGTLGGTQSTGVAINSNGQVTGQSYLPGNTTSHAYIHTDGAMVDLGTLGGGSSFGSGINDNGQVTGHSQLAGTQLAPFVDHAFLYSGGRMIDLGTLGGLNSAALAINNGAAVAGGSSTADNQSNHAFVYSGGAFTDLGTFGGVDSGAYGINNLGQVTGLARVTGDLSNHAFIYSGGRMVDIHTSPGNFSVGYAINDRGQVAGEFYSGGPNQQQHAFLYAGGSMVDLGTLGGSYSSGRGINADGLVTGISYMPGNTTQHAFLYASGTLYDLNALVNSGLDGAVLFDAAGINDRGQIAATGCKGSTCQAYRLDPDGDIDLPLRINVVEYHNSTFDHYFITPIPEEIALLDARVAPFQDWSRTNWSFLGYANATAPAASAPICRFFNSTFAPKSSHFYAPQGFGCETTVAIFPDWKLEDDKLFNTLLPDANGACPQGSVPLYRLYNNGMGGAPNHRFVAELTERQKMIDKGFVAEGAGIGVGMCVPL